jgi:hypothetical protein
MLIVIAGITGNVGHHLARSALRRNHQVRGLGRNPDKLDPAIREKLESFVVSKDYQDISAYEKACQGADAVIAAFNWLPILLLDSQLLLLRAAEKADIKRFHGVSWNGDWSNKALGELTSYDALISFARQAFCSSTIKPTFSFIGVFANTLFAVPGAGALEDVAAMWIRHGDPKDNKRTFRYVGSPDVAINWTPEEDAADFTVALITSEYGLKGGYYRFWSDTFTAKQLKDAFESVRGGQVELQQIMELETGQHVLAKMKADATAAGPEVFQSQMFQICGLEYGCYFAAGLLQFEAVDADKFPDVRRTKIADYIKENSYV